jgi:hypothetical protein
MAVTIRNNTLEFDTDSTINSIGDVGVDIDTGRILGHDGTSVKTVAWTSDVPTLAVYSAEATVANGATTSVSHDTSVAIALPFANERVDSIDADIALLLYCDGPNGSTTITDETGKTVTSHGGASITTSHYVFPSGSLDLDGTDDYCTVPDHADFPSGTSDFTIECRARFASVSGNAQIMCHGSSSNETSYAWSLRREGTSVKFYASSGTGVTPESGGVFAGNFNTSSPETTLYGAVVTTGNGASISGGYINISGTGWAVTPDAAWMTFGANDLRIEMKVIATSLPSGKIGLLWRASGSEYWYLYLEDMGSTTARIGFLHGGSGLPTVAIYSNAFSFALNTLHHVGIQRNGTSVNLFANGALLTLSSGGTAYSFGSSAWADPADPNLNIGSSDGSRLAAHLQGKIDGIQICCAAAGGVSLYGSTYTVPTGDYVATGSQWDIVSGVSLGTVTQNTWYALAVTRSSNTWSLYLDGTRGNSITSSTGMRNASGPVTIGRLSSSASDYMHGQLDEIVIRTGTASYTGASYTVPVAETTGITTTYRALPIGTADGIGTMSTSASTVFTNNTGASVTARFGVVKLA